MTNANDPRLPKGWPPPEERSVGTVLRSVWAAVPASSKPTGIMLLSYGGLVVLAVGIVSTCFAWMVVLR